MSGYDADEIGSIYAAWEPADDDLMPGDPADEWRFERLPVPAAAWFALERADLYDRMHAIEHGGLIGAYEECWFKSPQLPELAALLEAVVTAVPEEARVWLAAAAAFARRAHARGVGLTFVIGGEARSVS